MSTLYSPFIWKLLMAGMPLSASTAAPHLSITAANRYTGAPCF